MRTLNTILLTLTALSASCAATHDGAGAGETRGFQVENRFDLEIPADGRQVRAWFALPDGDEPLQRVDDLQVTIEPALAGITTREVRDAAGNRFLYLESDALAGRKLTLTTAFRVQRKEALTDVDPDRTRPLTPGERKELGKYCGSDANIVIDLEMRKLAGQIVGDEPNPIRQARLVYDWVLDNVTYWVKHPDRMKSSGVGSSQYTLENGCGNCTDFHSLYAAIARAAGLPTRMVYGSFFKGPLNGVDKDQSYHCWIEVWAPDVGWIPIDVAVADIFVDDFELNDANRDGVALTVADGYRGPDRALVDYYFGNLDARRVTWNRGRDLLLEPRNASGPVNALPKAHVEVDGKPLPEKAGWTRKLTFREL
jgi:transglutaminase-like putative cysteine protease